MRENKVITLTQLQPVLSFLFTAKVIEFITLLWQGLPMDALETIQHRSAFMEWWDRYNVVFNTLIVPIVVVGYRIVEKRIKKYLTAQQEKQMNFEESYRKTIEVHKMHAQSLETILETKKLVSSLLDDYAEIVQWKRKIEKKFPDL